MFIRVWFNDFKVRIKCFHKVMTSMQTEATWIDSAIFVTSV